MPLPCHSICFLLPPPNFKLKLGKKQNTTVIYFVWQEHKVFWWPPVRESSKKVKNTCDTNDIVNCHLDREK